MPENVDNRPPVTGDRLPSTQEMVTEAARIIHDGPAIEYVVEGTRFVGYPLENISHTLEAFAVEATSEPLPVLPFKGIEDGKAFFEMPNDSITLKGAILENQLADSSEPVIPIMEELGRMIHSLHPHHAPRGLGLGRVLIDRKSGEIKFLPTVKYEEAHKSGAHSTVNRIDAELKKLIHGRKREDKIKTFRTALTRYAFTEDKNEKPSSNA